MPQNMLYLDLPGIHGAVEATKAARMQNQLYQQQMARQERINALLPGAAGGEPGAMTQLAGLDPQSALNIAKLNEAQRETAIANMDELMLAYDHASQSPAHWNQTIDYLSRVDPSFEQYRDQYENRGVIGARLKAMRAAAAAKKGSSITPAQTANNAEIDNARRMLDNLRRSLPPGVTLAEELHRRMSNKDPRTGRMIPDYNSFWGRFAYKAAQAKIGGDPDQARYAQFIMGQGEGPPIPDPISPPTASGKRQPAVPRTGDVPPPDAAPATFDKLKARIDNGEAIPEAELREIHRTDPALWKQLREYLESPPG